MSRRGALPLKPQNLLQDLPPRGGFVPFGVDRRIPVKGPHGAVLWALAAGVVAYGYFKVLGTNEESSLFREERFSARAAIAPFLQAEEDARFHHSRTQWLMVEAEVMKKVDGWKPGASVYSSSPVWTNELGAANTVQHI